MHVSSLTLHDFRNYRDLLFHPEPGLNILLGKNAQGKTGVLEAIYLLAASRSWRTSKDVEMIHWDGEASRVFAEVRRDAQNDVDISITFGRADKKQVYINTIRQTRLADFMGNVNIVLIEPHDLDIVRGEPSVRRRFLNMEISQIQPQYCHLLSNYKRVLEQRNRLLKNIQAVSAEGLLEVLTEQLVSYGARLLERRLAFVARIAELARVLHDEITDGEETLSVEYRSGTDLEGAEHNYDALSERLAARVKELHPWEIRRGVTLAGPHRDDVSFMVNDADARTYGSQGQQRTIALSLRLSELEVMQEAAGEPPIVLLDDVMTDLDEDRRAHVFSMTRGRCQTFITAASRRAFDEDFLSEGRIFHVRSGEVFPE